MTLPLGSCAARRVGSTPTTRTMAPQAQACGAMFSFWKVSERSAVTALDGHGAHFLRRDMEALAVSGPVPGGGPDEPGAGEGHGGGEHPLLTPGYRPGQFVHGTMGHKAEGGIQNGLAAADLQHRAEGIAVLAAEQLHHGHRRVVLVRLQKAAVDEHREGGLVPRGVLLQGFEEIEQGHRNAVNVEGEHQQHLAARLQFGAQLQMVGGADGAALRGQGAAPGEELGIAPGVGLGRPGAAVQDQQLCHFATSSHTTPSSSEGVQNTIS